MNCNRNKSHIMFSFTCDFKNIRILLTLGQKYDLITVSNIWKRGPV